MHRELRSKAHEVLKPQLHTLDPTLSWAMLGAVFAGLKFQEHQPTICSHTDVFPSQVGEAILQLSRCTGHQANRASNKANRRTQPLFLRVVQDHLAE